MKKAWGDIFSRRADALQSHDWAPGKTRAQLLQRERMALLGQLVSGIAHEINNPLTGILGIVGLALSDPGLQGQLREDLEVVLRETKRIKNIVSDMLLFSRNYNLELERVDPGALIGEVVRFLEHQAKFSRIQINNLVPADLAPIESNASELKQVFMNIILNALGAMGQGGTLDIFCQFVDDNHLAFLFKDTGCGIPAQNLKNIFDPFFTTKTLGEGTGLGLSISLDIVKNLGGQITAESKGEGKGATFTVILPYLKEDAP